jgi:hypothetical protein
MQKKSSVRISHEPNEIRKRHSPHTDGASYTCVANIPMGLGGDGTAKSALCQITQLCRSLGRVNMMLHALKRVKVKLNLQFSPYSP